MNLAKLIKSMAHKTRGTAYRQTFVIVKPFYGLQNLFEGTVQELIDAYYNKHDFGSAGAESWSVVNYHDFNYQHKDEPQVAKHILIEVV